jgi:protein phosphatase
MTLLRSGSATDTGLVRSVNQDLAVESPTLFAVADGMGGHAGGEVAARLAVDTLSVSFGRQPTGAGLSEAVTQANTVVWERSLENPELRGMGTTMTAAALVNEAGRDVLALVNVGDSRSYRFHEGELTQITTDHSLAEEMVRTGELTVAEASVHPHRHILTRALGVSADVAVDLWRIQPVRGDRFLLCSDGLTNELEPEQISEVLATVPDPQIAADLLVRAARTHGGSDNITVVVIDVVVGEDDADNESAVAAVTPDFQSELVPASTDDGAPEESVENLSGPEPLKPKWRDRRRAKRRARRAARGRRVVTLRTILFFVVLGAIVAGGLFALKWYDTNSYFVQAKGNELVIYQGRIGGFLWYHPVKDVATGITTADIPAYYVPAVQAGVEKSSVADAQTYVNNLVQTQCQQNPTVNPLGCASAGTATSTTTTAPAKAGSAPTTTKAP